MIWPHRSLVVVVLLQLYVWASESAFAQFDVEIHDLDHIPRQVHAARRDSVLATLSPRTAVIVLSADTRNRQNDVDYEYRQNSDLLYLTGFEYPGATLLLVPGGIDVDGKRVREVLFVRERNRSREQWSGVAPGPEEAKTLFGLAATLPASDLTKVLNDVLPELDTILLPSLPTRTVTLTLLDKNIALEGELKKGLKALYGDLTVNASWRGLARMRETKDTAELRLLQRAIDISIAGHVAAMKSARPGMKEYELEAVMEYEFKRLGAEDVGYASIVGSKYNACILHYTSNRRATIDGELVLADCGAEYHGYTADITRTFPMNGRFSAEQRIIYDIVLEAQDSGIAACRVGNGFRDPHVAAQRVISRRLRELGIIDDESKVRQYFMHGTSHYLGLDVHDAGTFGPLRPNTVLTVEPGIYIARDSDCDPKWWNIGIRIEDDIVVTEKGPINMSGALPRKAEEIERLVLGSP
ncbi:MAG TPA: aminopeptidase P N-terminal domain-containing protein [Chlorobiota bacterium]|nr:aminopeptidase P N-terminal domain-containing protein [Chlorobiota bacterium]